LKSAKLESAGWPRRGFVARRRSFAWRKPPATRSDKPCRVGRGRLTPPAGLLSVFCCVIRRNLSFRRMTRRGFVARRRSFAQRKPPATWPVKPCRVGRVRLALLASYPCSFVLLFTSTSRFSWLHLSVCATAVSLSRPARLSTASSVLRPGADSGSGVYGRP
jgi:hypothetical protein